MPPRKQTEELPAETPPPSRLIFSAMLGIMADIEAIAKSQKQGSGVKYAFRSIEEVMNAIHPVLVKHGVFILGNVENVKNETFTVNGKTVHGAVLTMKYNFVARDGSYVYASFCAEATDYSDKATQQAGSYCFKDLLCKTFCIPTEGVQDDGDGKQPELPKVADKLSPTTQSAPAPIASSRLADLPKVADSKARTDGVIEQAKEAVTGDVVTEAGWTAIKKEVIQFFNPDGIAFDEGKFHDWSVKTLRQNNLVVPLAMADLTTEAGGFLWKVGNASKKAGELLYSLPA